MSMFTLKVGIDKSSYPEMGNPFSPDKINQRGVSRSDKEDFEGYRQSVGLALPVTGKRSRKYSTDQEDSSWDDSRVTLSYTYEDTTSRTYKFSGMDVDEDFNAIIKVGEGHVIVGSMFDRKLVSDLVRVNTGSYFDDYLDRDRAEFYNNKIKSIVQSVPENLVRKITTSLKTGSFYSLNKQQKFDIDSSEYREFLSDFIKNLIKDYEEESGSIQSDSESGVIGFSSVILNIVHGKEESRESTRTFSDSSSGNEDRLMNIMKGFVGTLFTYWSNLCRDYSNINSELSALDLWSDLNKRVIGEGEFNRRFKSSVELIDSDTGEIADRMVSFSGVSRNGGVFDSNVIRNQASDSLDSLSRSLVGNLGYNEQPDIRSILLSNIDSTDIEDVWSLTDEEAQALSVLDSLRYIDEDADISRASYDMNDPDQRGLFVKSCIRSYERNFREFKPATQYDVTEALAELVERGDIESNPEITQAQYSKDDTLSGDIVTSTDSVVMKKINTQELKKVMKLVDKFSKQILDGFDTKQTA